MKLGPQGKENLQTAVSAAIASAIFFGVKELWEYAFSSKPKKKFLGIF